ncbi:MAG: hypothetical protein RR379_03850 [Clostridia bacterium]
MSILITDSSLGVQESPETGSPFSAISCPFQSPYMPCATREHLLFCCRQALDCLCLSRANHRELCRMPAMPALSALCPSPCERYLYQLSSEADCVHTRRMATGELLFAAPTGVFPRMMRLHPSGRALLVAGGAVNEAYLLRAPELSREGVIELKSPCFAADFWSGGLILVCASEREDIQTVVYTLAPHAVRPHELIELPGQPGALCVCPDGFTALLSTPDGLMKLDIRTGKLLWNLPEWALCMGLCCKGSFALLSDTLCGQVCLLSHEQPWLKRTLCTGADAQACFC